MIWFRDYPREKMAHEAADAAGQPPVGYGFLAPAGMLLAMFPSFAGNFTFYICISWMHPYLIEHYSLTPSQAARYSMIPLLCGASSNWVAGFVVDAIYRSS